MIYPGGKNSGGAYQRIICQIPPHDLYIEPFLGSGAVMRMKRPARVNIGIDKDAGAVERFNGALAQSELAASAKVIKVGCGISFLKSYRLRGGWTGSEVIYCDPPYLPQTRRQSRRLYLHEMSYQEHVELLQTLLDISSGFMGVKILISGYESELYEKAIGHWRKISWQAITRGGTLATECLWMNYQEPVELHDYSYLGENRTERQRIKRKIERWENKLAGMAVLERQALMAAIDRTKG